MSSPDKNALDETKRLMGALLRMPPRPHSEMKLGKAKLKKSESPKKKDEKK